MIYGVKCFTYITVYTVYGKDNREMIFVQLIYDKII